MSHNSCYELLHSDRVSYWYSLNALGWSLLFSRLLLLARTWLRLAGRLISQVWFNHTAVGINMFCRKYVYRFEIGFIDLLTIRFNRDLIGNGILYWISQMISIGLRWDFLIYWLYGSIWIEYEMVSNTGISKWILFYKQFYIRQITYRTRISAYSVSRFESGPTQTVVCSLASTSHFQGKVSCIIVLDLTWVTYFKRTLLWQDM